MRATPAASSLSSRSPDVESNRCASLRGLLAFNVDAGEGLVHAAMSGTTRRGSVRRENIAPGRRPTGRSGRPWSGRPRIHGRALHLTGLEEAELEVTSTDLPAATELTAIPDRAGAGDEVAAEPDLAFLPAG